MSPSLSGFSLLSSMKYNEKLLKISILNYFVTSLIEIIEMDHLDVIISIKKSNLET